MSTPHHDAHAVEYPVGIFTLLVLVAIVQVVQLRSQGKMNRSKWLTAVAVIVLFVYRPKMIISSGLTTA